MPDKEPERPAPSPGFGEFLVETERMADGRSIHYYSWPADTAASDDAGLSGDATADAPASTDTPMARPGDV
jgi:hypothetical protein